MRDDQSLNDRLLFAVPKTDIPVFVGEGRVDLRITGHDQVRESCTTEVEQILDLGFGKCKLQVQVPEMGDIQDPKDLVGQNIVTSFVSLTREYFEKLEVATKIKYVGGSVEAACALGVADGIVDLVESGETMKAAGLKPIATLIETSAVLIKSKHPSHPELIDRIRGVITAQKYVLCTYNIPHSKLPYVVQITPGKLAPTVTQLMDQGDEDWAAVSVMVEKSKTAIVMDQLEEVGATDILVMNLSNSRSS
ncbi:ATP phosphoribosyltransferase-domain-containing protein [Terfezia claveryi]|nr:ATP phosphoribosyltransferase-domain-containing protein [Terfezia claveryi]